MSFAEPPDVSHNALAANLGSFSGIIEAMPDAVVIADSSARVCLLNQSASILLGYSPSDLVDQPVEAIVRRFLHSEEELSLLAYVRTELCADRPVRGETTVHGLSGRSLRIQWNIAPVKNDHGQLAHYVAVLRDVTSDDKRQQTTEEGRQFLRSAFDAICARMAVVSPSGTILTVNDAWRGSDRNDEHYSVDPVGMTYLDSYGPADADVDNTRARIQEGFQSVVDGRLNQFYLEYASRQGAEERWWSVRLAAFHELPPCRVIAAHFDITERKNVEQLVQRRFEGQHVLSNLLARVLDRSTDNGETAMVEALRAVSTFLEADRAYIIMLDEDRSTLVSVRSFSSPNLPAELEFPIETWRAAIRGDAASVSRCGEFVDVVMSHLEPDETFRVESIHRPPAHSTDRRILESHRIRSLVCVPIVHAHRIVGFGGVDTIQNERSWSDENVEFLRSAFDVLGAATSSWRGEELLRSIVEGMASSGESFLDVLVEQICFGLGVDNAFVAEIMRDNTAHILAFAGLSGPIAPMSMHLAGTPAEDIATLGEPCIYRKNVRAQFPNDKLLTQCNAHAYAGVPLLDATGQIIGFIAIMHGRLLSATKLTMDILRVFAGRAASEIDRRRKDDALVALNHALEDRVAERAAVAARQVAAMDATTEGMAIWAGDDYVYMNDAHAKMYGYESGNSLLGHSWRELYFDAERERIERDALPTLGRDRMFRGEFIGKRRDGSTFDVHLSLSLADGGDIICCCQDITEQKRIQTELSAHRDELRLANIELSRAAQHKDEFLASMSHELRTPLNGMLGMTEILVEQIVGKLNEKQLSCLRVVDESGKHLLALINDILDLSKIEAGALGLELSVVDARAVCEASLRVVRPAADTKKHKVNLNCPANPGYLRVDERRVKQMLVNLLDNAIKFTPAGGFVGLDIEDHPELGAIYFVVWDNGIGITPEHQPQLFKPFSQIEIGLARQHSGTGLGLSLVKRLAELHGGSVSVESSPGRGSRFTISLPRGSGRMPVPAVRSITPGRPSRAVIAGMPTVLVVDDNVPNLTMLRDYLALKGFDVITAQSGQEALEIADRTSISAILMDIQMPGMDGLAAIRSLRRSPLHATIPILATTAHVMPGDRERCLAAGATEYLAKPMSPRQIITILLRILAPALSVVT